MNQRGNRCIPAQFYRQQERDMGILAAHAEYNHVPLVKGRIFKPEMVKWGKLPDLAHDECDRGTLGHCVCRDRYK